MKTLKLSFFLFLLLAACGEDDTMTSAQLTAKRLKKDISERREIISNIDVYNGNSIFSGSSYKITSDGFIVVSTGASSATFNLEQLKSYIIGTNSLTLYF